MTLLMLAVIDVEQGYAQNGSNSIHVQHIIYQYYTKIAIHIYFLIYKELQTQNNNDLYRHNILKLTRTYFTYN